MILFVLLASVLPGCRGLAFGFGASTVGDAGPCSGTNELALRDVVSCFDGLIVDAGPRGPLHDGEVRNARAARILDAFEAAGKPVVLAVDGACPADIEVATLARLGLLDADAHVTLRERLYPRTREERRAAAACVAPAVVGAVAAAALARAVVDDGGRALEASAVSPRLAGDLVRVFGSIGTKCVSFAACPGDALDLLDVLHARPAPLTVGGGSARCALATGFDAFWDELGDGDAGYVSLSEFEARKGERCVDAFLEDRLAELAADRVALVVVLGEHRQRARRGIASLASTYRRLGGRVEEVGYVGDDALLLRCAIDELARRGAKRERVLVLASGDRPCREAERAGLATAVLA